MTTETSLVKVKFRAGQHPNSKKNLKPFKKGSPGNPRASYTLTAALRDALGDAKKRKKLIDSTIEGAILREPTPFKEVWDRVDGRLQDSPPPYSGTRVINIIVLSERAKELTENVSNRFRQLEPAEAKGAVIEND